MQPDPEERERKKKKQVRILKTFIRKEITLFFYNMGIHEVFDPTGLFPQGGAR